MIGTEQVKDNPGPNCCAGKAHRMIRTEEKAMDASLKGLSLAKSGII